MCAKPIVTKNYVATEYVGIISGLCYTSDNKSKVIEFLEAQSASRSSDWETSWAGSNTYTIRDDDDSLEFNDVTYSIGMHGHPVAHLIKRFICG